MNSILKEQLVTAMTRFKRVGMSFPPSMDLNMSEFFLMNGIAKVAADKPVRISEIQTHHHFTKPAVSQMLNALEKKGYVEREIDSTDRRKISVKLTPDGKAMLKKTIAHADDSLDQVITRFGEENTHELIRLLSLLADISEEIKKESMAEEPKPTDR